MKKVFGRCLCVMILILGVAASAQALDLHPDYAVESIIDGSISEAGDLYYGQPENSSYGRDELLAWFGVDVCTDSPTEVEAPADDPLEFTADFSSFTGYLSVKHDNMLSLYDLTGGGTAEMYWSAPEITQIPEGQNDTFAWSHYRLYECPSIPDPAAVFLLGSACIFGWRVTRRMYI